LNSEKQLESKTTPSKAEPSISHSKPVAGETKPPGKPDRQRPNASIRFALFGFLGIVLVGLLGSPAIAKWLFSATATATQTSEIRTQNLNPPLATETLTDEVTVLAPSPTAALSTLGVDHMPLILIPAGDFQMGSIGNAIDERPIHTVYLNDYFIDQTEVTNSMYEACVQSGKCELPRANTSHTRHVGNNSSYYADPEFENYPVIYVSWNDAKDYCEYVGRRLPTEAEWEKAASWDDAKDVKRIYPWGNSIDCSYANFYGGENRTLCVGDTTPVGSYLNGASFYGVLDLAGNVAEWVSDRYDPQYYGNSPDANPLGPRSGDYIVVRGGSFLVGSDNNIRSSDREKLPPDTASHNVGFRCAMDATP
jgi:formylglycine-generating enzyme required for sulfatase activity